MSQGRDAILGLKNFVDDELTQVNELILSNIQSYASLIPKVSDYLISSGGKRLRPLLTLACAKIVGAKAIPSIKLAAAVEFIHTATLLHDDVIDESELRRGIATANKVWSNKTSILVGDYLLSQSFNLMVEAGSLKALGMLSASAATITEAEVWQLDLIANTEMQISQYIELIKGKTAVLFAASCAVCAVHKDLPQAVIDMLYGYGLNMGICFQIVDDTLDYFATSNSFGKEIGNDIKEGKITLPMIYLLQKADATERQELIDIIKSRGLTQKQSAHLRELMDKYVVLDYCLDTANSYASVSERIIAAMPEHYDTALLREVLDSLVKRVC